MKRQMQDPAQRYIQGVLEFGESWAIICFLPDSIRDFIRLESFQLDMSYKRLRGEEHRELTIGDYNRITKRCKS